jgi:hypothetical protein
MRISHFVPLRGSRIDVFREILSELGIRNECQLYAVVLNDEVHPTLLLSAIPPKSWPGVYKLTVNLASREGTFADAVNIVSGLGINILASWTASTTASGEGCWAAVVELPEDYPKKETNTIKDTIEKSLNDKSLLSNSPLYTMGLDLVQLAPLKVIHTLHKLIENNKEFIGHVKNHFIDFREFIGINHENLYDEFIRKPYVDHFERASDYCLVTPDTEERYLRVTLLPYLAEMLNLSMKITIHSPNKQFKGYFGQVLQSIKSLRLNLYSSDNFLLEKSNNRGEPEHEVATFAFSVDARHAQLPTERRNWQSFIYSKIFADLNSFTKSNNGHESIDFPSESFKVLDALSIFPRCFLATNARKDEKSGRCAIKVIEKLRGLRLQPVNTDITRTKTIEEDVNHLIKACPFVVSLFFPIENNKLVISGDDINQHNESHAPSDWVLYEEAFAKALGKRVFRMRHRAVRKPRYAGQEREFVFTDKSFESELDELIKAIQTFQAMDDYALAVRASDEEAAIIPPALLKRDLDQEYGHN